MTVRSRTPISDYYQHKERMKKQEQAKAANSQFKVSTSKNNNTTKSN